MTDVQDGFGAQFKVAQQRGTERLRDPRAVAARYDAGRGRVVVTLSSGIELGLLPRDVEGLASASAAERRVVEVDAMGLGIHFPRLDADLYVPALLEGILGSRSWMAVRLGAAGGHARLPRRRRHAGTTGAVSGPAGL